MKDNQKEASVYELGYLLASSLSEENVPTEVEAIKKLITDAGGNIISDESPHLHDLAYEIRIKKLSGSYEKYSQAYFGWVKFEVGSDLIDKIKKSAEVMPSMVRMLITKTVKENTYLGKKAAAILTRPLVEVTEEKVEKKEDAAPATIEEMDKSIDEMVKEVN